MSNRRIEAAVRRCLDVTGAAWGLIHVAANHVERWRCCRPPPAPHPTPPPCRRHTTPPPTPPSCRSRELSLGMDPFWIGDVLWYNLGAEMLKFGIRRGVFWTFHSVVTWTYLEPTFCIQVYRCPKRRTAAADAFATRLRRWWSRVCYHALHADARWIGRVASWQTLAHCVRHGSRWSRQPTEGTCF